MTKEPSRALRFLWDVQAEVATARGKRGFDAERAASLMHVAVDKMNLEGFPGPRGDVLDRFRNPPAHWPPAGPHEDRGIHQLIHSLADTVEEHLTGPFARPVLGSLATGEINAVTLRVPGSSEHIVLFEDELPTYLLLFSKAVAYALPKAGDGQTAFARSQDRVRDIVENSPEALLRFREVVLAYLLHGSPNRAPQYFAPSRINHTAVHLLHAMECFVLGHEYGHIAAGHLSEKVGRRRLLGDEDLEFDEVEWSWQQELVADQLGWRAALLTTSSEEEPSLYGHIGAELFLLACEVLENARNLFTTGAEAPDASAGTHTHADADADERNGSHPPAWLRREMLRETLTNTFTEDSDLYVEAAQSIEETVAVLWEHTAPLVEELRRTGHTPDARWT
ncbi:hypothetical protein [Streptomyces venezuelae]